MKYTIEIKDLIKSYPNFVLNINDLKLQSGTIIGLIGENGAGKTTFIKSILNIIKPNSGEIKIFNQNLNDNEQTIKEDIGVVLDNSFFPENLNCKNIDSIMKKIYNNWDHQLFYQYLRSFNLQDNQPLKTMSKGMRKKVEIATALSHHPKLLILDEPTSGLDPIVRNEVLDLFMNFIQDEENTILFSTHITTDLEHIADSIVFINKGQVVLNKEMSDILDNYAIIKCDDEQFATINKQDIISFIKNKYEYEVLTDKKENYPQLIIDKITIEELMLQVIKGER